MQLCSLHLAVYVSLTTTSGLLDSTEYPNCNTYTGWMLFKVNVRPQHELAAKRGGGGGGGLGGGGRTFVHGPSFVLVLQL